MYRISVELANGRGVAFMAHLGVTGRVFSEMSSHLHLRLFTGVDFTVAE